MKLEVYTCDVCSTQKGEANHWWRVVPDPNVPSFTLVPFSVIPRADHQHVCGQECAAKALAKWMAAQ
jgi:hypothetical protein